MLEPDFSGFRSMFCFLSFPFLTAIDFFMFALRNIVKAIMGCLDYSIEIQAFQWSFFTRQINNKHPKSPFNPQSNADSEPFGLLPISAFFIMLSVEKNLMLEYSR